MRDKPIVFSLAAASALFICVLLFNTACYPETAGLLNARDFGAEGNGETDDTDALQEAIDAAREARTGVYIPSGTYRVTRTLNVRVGTYLPSRAIRITGEYSILEAGAEMNSIIDVDTGQYVTIKRLILDGNHLARHGLTAFKLSGKSAVVEQVDVLRAVSHGFFLEKCQGAVFRNCQSKENGGDGWRIIDSNASLFDSVQAMSNSGNGFSILSEDFTGGCTLRDIWAEKNRGHGIRVKTSMAGTAVVLRDGWIEGNALDGVRIESVGTVVQGLQVLGTGKDGNRAIRILKTASGSHITGNYVQRGPNGREYGNIRLEGNPEIHHIEGNFYRFRGAPIQPEIAAVEG